MTIQGTIGTKRSSYLDKFQAFFKTIHVLPCRSLEARGPGALPSLTSRGDCRSRDGVPRLLFASPSLGTTPQVFLCGLTFLSLLRPCNPRGDEPPLPFTGHYCPDPFNQASVPVPSLLTVLIVSGLRHANS